MMVHELYQTANAKQYSDRARCKHTGQQNKSRKREKRVSYIYLRTIQVGDWIKKFPY